MMKKPCSFLNMLGGLAMLVVTGSCLAAEEDFGDVLKELNKEESAPQKTQKASPKKDMPRKSKSNMVSSQRSSSASFSAPEMVTIRGGCFLMGSPESEPDRENDERQHQVCVKDFEIGKYEVTQAQWQEVMGNNPAYFKNCGGNCPVEQVSWNDVQKFLQKLNAQTGKNYRLPTEAEWEYAARAGTTTAYYWGNTASHDYANYGTDACCKGLVEGNDQWLNTSPVGSFPANGFGLYDMAGNVWEWTCSAYVETYDGSETQCSNDAKHYGVVRGGAWDGLPLFLRSAVRNEGLSDVAYGLQGFRISRAL